MAVINTFSRILSNTPNRPYNKGREHHSLCFGSCVDKE